MRCLIPESFLSLNLNGIIFDPFHESPTMTLNAFFHSVSHLTFKQNSHSTN